jgi:hypothetical protein
MPVGYLPVPVRNPNDIYLKAGNDGKFLVLIGQNRKIYASKNCFLNPAKDLGKAIPKNANNCDAMMQVYYEAKNFNEAKKWMNELLAPDPHHPSVLEYKRHFNCFKLSLQPVEIDQ